MAHKDLIRKLGGPTFVARAMGREPSVGVKWTLRGIPPLYWHAIAQMPQAKEHGITVETIRDGSPLASRGPQQGAA